MKPTKDKYPRTETDLKLYSPLYHIVLPIDNEDKAHQNCILHRIKTLKQNQLPEQELPTDGVLICW